MATELEPGVSRRDLLKKGAVAGGIVWTAPLILSATDVAGAMHGSEQVCMNYFAAQYLTNGSGQLTASSSCIGSLGSQSCYTFPPGKTYGSACGAVSSIDPENNQVHLNSTIDGKTILDVFAYSKGGNACDGENTTVTPTATGWTISFPTSVGSNATSNVQFVLCTS